MTLSINLGWDFTIAPSGEAGHSQQAIPLHPPVSSSIPLHNDQAVPLLFLICPQHTCTLWWLLLQAGHMAGSPLGNIPQQVEVHGLPVRCTRGQVFKWHD